MPWTTFNFQGYRFENEIAAQDMKGNIYSLEMLLNPSLQFDVEKDVSSVNGADDEWNYRVTFVYPPRNNKKTLLDGAVAQEAFVKKNMKNSLKEKVRRKKGSCFCEVKKGILFHSNLIREVKKKSIYDIL